MKKKTWRKTKMKRSVLTKRTVGHFWESLISEIWSSVVSIIYVWYFKAVNIILDIWGKQKVRFIVQWTCFSSSTMKNIIWKDCIICHPFIPQPPPPDAGASGFILFLSSESFSPVDFWRNPCYMCYYLNCGFRAHMHTLIHQPNNIYPWYINLLRACEYA